MTPLDLTSGWAVAESLPAPVHAKERLASAVGRETHPGELTALVEGDLALTAAVLRLANRQRSAEPVADVRSALERLPAASLTALAQSVPAADVLDPAASAAERVRLHALATRATAERIADETGLALDAELRAALLLHDVGKLVLSGAGYEAAAGHGQTPEQRVAAERQALGTDHAAVGAELALRWRLPARVAEAVRGHHDASSGDAAAVRLADMLTHYAHGRLVDLSEVLDVAGGLGVTRDALGRLMYDLPLPADRRPAQAEPCPLSDRELEVLRLLAGGMVYKQIAHELSLSASTVRNHLHRIYARLEVPDRAQAILMCSERGWL